MKKLRDKYNSLSITVKASLWFLICSFLQKAVSMITTPIFTRLLNTAEYGQYNVFNSWLGIITIFVSLNLSMGVYVQGLVKFDKERKVFSSSLQGLSFTLCLSWTVIYISFHSFWNKLFSLTTVQMLCMMVMIWASAAYGFWSSEQRVEYKYKELVRVTLIVSIAQPLVGILFVTHANDKVTARILGLALVQFIGYSWCFLVQIRQGKVFDSKKVWKYALSYNIPLIPHYLSQIILNNSDRIMINSMVGSSEAGIYSLAYSIAMIMTLFNNALVQTLNPWIFQKIKEKKIKEIAPVGYISLTLIAILNILLITVAPEVVRIFAPVSYYDAVYCIPPVAMGVLFLFTYDLFSKFAFYFEKTKSIMLASVGGAVLNIVLNYFGIQIWGYIAAAYTTLICYIFYSIFHYILMTRMCNTYLNGVKPYNLRILLEISIGFLFCGFAISLTYNMPAIRYSIVGTLVVIALINRKKIINIVLQFKNMRKMK